MMRKTFMDRYNNRNKGLKRVFKDNYVRVRVALVICVLFLGTNGLWAEEADSLPDNRQSRIDSQKLPQKIDKLSSSRLYQMTYVGVPLVAAGLIVKGEDDHFRSLRNDYMPRFRNHPDNYLQYSGGC